MYLVASLYKNETKDQELALAEAIIGHMNPYVDTSQLMSFMIDFGYFIREVFKYHILLTFRKYLCLLCYVIFGNRFHFSNHARPVLHINVPTHAVPATDGGVYCPHAAAGIVEGHQEEEVAQGRGILVAEVVGRDVSFVNLTVPLIDFHALCR